MASSGQQRVINSVLHGCLQRRLFPRPAFAYSKLTMERPGQCLTSDQS